MRISQIFLAALLAASAAAAAQTYPARPVRIIVPFSPGGPSDILGRLVSPRLSAAWNQQVVIDNRGGANSIIGTEIVAKADPDGYTLGVISAGFTVNASLYAKLPYDPLRDFAAVTLLAAGPAIVMVHPSLPAKTVKELVALAKSKPGQLTYASSGNGSPSHLAVELFKTMTGTQFIHVPYKGIAPGIIDLLAGQVHLSFPTIIAGLPHAKTGRLRALAVSSSKRSPAAPEIPTLSESGVPGYEATNWYGMLAPAKTPAAVIRIVNAEVAKALTAPEAAERLVSQGMDPAPTTPDAFSAYLRSEIDKWGKVVKASGAKPDQ